MALAGHDEASGHEPVPFTLGDLVRFTGQEGFVYLNFAGAHDRVRTHLVPGLEDDNVIKHQLLSVDDRTLPVPDNSRMGRVKHSHLVQHLLRPDLLDDADQRVGHDDNHEGEVSPGSYQDKQDGKDGKYKVEVGEDIFMDNLFRRPGRRLHRTVYPAVQVVFLHLHGRQTGPVVRLIPGGRYPPVFLLLCLYCFSSWHSIPSISFVISYLFFFSNRRIPFMIWMIGIFAAARPYTVNSCVSVSVWTLNTL